MSVFLSSQFYTLPVTHCHVPVFPVASPDCLGPFGTPTLIPSIRAGNGEFIVVLDSQDRENEGDLVIAAECITDAQMAFLVRYTRLDSRCVPMPAVLYKMSF